MKKKNKIYVIVGIVVLLISITGTVICFEKEPKLYCGHLSMFEYPNSWGDSGYVLYFEDRMFFVVKSKVMDLDIEKDYEKTDCCIEYTIVKEGTYGNAYYIELLDIKGKLMGNQE